MASQHTPPSAPLPLGVDGTAHQRIVQAMMAQARPLLEHVVEAARMSLQSRLDTARTPGEHHAMQEARQQLMRLAPVMAERYPDALRKALADTSLPGDDKPTRSLFTIHFDELELMDETQINDSVERARARQMLMSAVEGPLADLDALVCGALGMQRVQPDSNPLRPDVFLQALQAAVSQMQVSEQVRHDWMGPMAQALGGELRKLYLAQIEQLQESGVTPAGYAMRQTGGETVYVAPLGSGAAAGFASDSDLSATAGAGDSLLTLERLRRLLHGEFSDGPAPLHTPAPLAPAPVDPAEAFADRFHREFEDPLVLPPIDAQPTDFAATVPAAFEALQEMKQVGKMMERLGSGQRAPQAGLADSGAAGAAVRGRGHGHGQGLGQALSMEVVSLMVDNIARDSRLLWPVQQFIRALEPALMQLALVDPRFFSHKEHAARRLLQDITDRSLAFGSTEDPGFQSFMRSLMNTAGPLATATIQGTEEFEQALAQLHAKWSEKERARKHERQRAIQALQHAEQRSLLAAQISRDIFMRPHIGRVPDEISRFLLGPWAQVMAQARLTDTSRSTDAGRYGEAVDALIWSAQPELTRGNTAQLARLLPKLLAKLREGLASIDYPETRTQAMFDALMQLHQLAFKPVPRAASGTPGSLEPSTDEATTPIASATSAPGAADTADTADSTVGAGPAGTPWKPISPEASQARHTPAATATEDAAMSAPTSDFNDLDDPWVAPSEARESGYIELSGPVDGVEGPGAYPPDGGTAVHVLHALTIGTWVSLLVEGRRERTQLSWISSNGRLFLFAGANGRSQSMTLRLVERLIQQGAMQVLSEHAIVEGALDAVAQLAMRNSVDSRL